MPSRLRLDAGTWIFAIHVRAALARIGAVVAAFIAGSITGCAAAGIVGSVAGSIGGVRGAAVGAIAAAAILVPLDVRVQFVRFPRPFAHVIAERLGLCGLLVCLLTQPGSFNLRLLGVRPGACRFRFALPGIEFPVLGLTADFGSLLAMRIVPLLLYSLSAASRCEHQQHNQHHHNYGD